MRNVGRFTPPSGLLEHIGEVSANIVSFIRKARERDPRTSNVGDERARPVEDVYARMHRESRVRQTRSLVIARHDEHGRAGLRDASQRFVGLIRDRRDD